VDAAIAPLEHFARARQAQQQQMMMTQQQHAADADAAAAEAESARFARVKQVAPMAADSHSLADDTADIGDRLLLDNLDGGLLFGEGGILHNSSAVRLLPEIDMGEDDEGTPLPSDADLAPVAWAPLGVGMDLDEGALWE